jgi:catechol 2,3-dioxygenase-like lactoylglutathione lyase family enzyme/uncharacterized protein (DUF1330 family)
MRRNQIATVLMLLLLAPQLNAQDSNSTKPSESELAKLLIPSAPAKTFQEHLAKTQVSDAVLTALETMPDAKPFIMLNFVRFRPHRDATLYMRYGMVAGRGVDVQGSYTPYYASAIHDLDASFGFDNSWDEMTMPVYSRLASYGLVQSNPDYQAALPDRVAGTFERLLYALRDGKTIFPATLSIQELHDDRKGIPHEKSDVLIGEFLRFKKPNGRETFVQFAKAVSPLIEKAGGDVLLSVEADIPVVSEKLWDHFTLTRYPSMDAFEEMFRSDDYIEAGRLRRAALDATITVPTSQAVEHQAKAIPTPQVVTFDHVHLISEDPKGAAAWYADKLGGKLMPSAMVDGAPQINVAFDGVHVTIRGKRKGENPAAKPGLQWGIDHFGLRIPKDFDAFCDRLKANGVIFTMGPRDFGDLGKVAYIRAPDGVRVELVFYKEQKPK